MRVLRSLFSSSLYVGVMGVSLLASGCSHLNEKYPSLGLPEPKMSNTAVGAVTGAALGAGVGVAIGSASGNAGEGAIAGTAVGAVAGSVVGNAIDRQDKQKRQYAVQDQEDTIKEQQLEINTLRKGEEDIASTTTTKSANGSRAQLARNYKGSSSKSSAAKYEGGLRQGYKGNPNAVPFSVEEEPEKQTTAKGKELKAVAKAEAKPLLEKETEKAKDKKQASVPAKSTIGSAEKTKASPVAVVKKEEPKKEVEKVASSVKEPEVKTEVEKTEKVEQPKQAAVGSEALPPAREVASNTATGEIKLEEEKPEKTTVASQPIEQPKEQPAVPQVETLPKAVESAAKRTPQDPACSNAEQEASRARRASSDADKLFYLRRAARLCPKFAGYHLEMGQIYSQIGRKEDARFAFNKALELEPESAEAKEQLSVIGQ